VDPGPFSIILLSLVYFLALFTLLHSLLFSTRYAHNLCFKQTGEIDNLIVSWEQSICLCVCRFRITSSRLSLLSWSRLNLGFLTERRLAAILIIPSSWGSQRAGYPPRTRTVCFHVNHTLATSNKGTCEPVSRNSVTANKITHEVETITVSLQPGPCWAATSRQRNYYFYPF
jgi:hypothetical protein